MLRTPLCDLLGTEVPIICAPFGPWEQVDLAAVCNAGALGSLGTALGSLGTALRGTQATRERFRAAARGRAGLPITLDKLLQ
jgi:nitronate monooxygenase/enoyl-[acyl-carrier protein] reductase II